MDPSNQLISTTDVAGTALKELFEMTQSITYRLSTHISLTPMISQSIISQTELISQINQVFKHQHQINQMNQQIQSANFVTSMTNFARTRQLQAIIQKGEKEILSLTRTITNLRLEIESLNSDIDSQREEAERLSKSLQNTQQVLKKAIVTYRHELDEQKRVLEEQGEQLQKLMHARVRNDFMLDSGYFGLTSLGLICLFVLRKTFFTKMVQLLTIYFPKRLRRRLNRFLELVSFVFMFLRLRKLLGVLGLHAGSLILNAGLET